MGCEWVHININFEMKSRGAKLGHNIGHDKIYVWFDIDVNWAWQLQVEELIRNQQLQNAKIRALAFGEEVEQSFGQNDA